MYLLSCQCDFFTNADRENEEIQHMTHASCQCFVFVKTISSIVTCKCNVKRISNIKKMKCSDNMFTISSSTFINETKNPGENKRLKTWVIPIMQPQIRAP